MPSSPLSPRLLKGALIRFTQKGNYSFPDKIIVFQYNPDTMTRKLEPWYGNDTDTKSSAPKQSDNAQPFDPTETFDLVLQLDATDVLEKPILNPLEVVCGVADRLAALEMLLYPQTDTIGGLLGVVSKALGNTAGDSPTGTSSSPGSTNSTSQGVSKTSIPRGTVPDLLFAWGPGRIVPVRITTFAAEEQLYSNTLYPLRAKVTLGMKLMAPRNYPCAKSQSTKLAMTMYNLYISQKKAWAEANMANNIESVITGLI